jgi:NAD(P)H dehydrogenase (quinone)
MPSAPSLALTGVTGHIGGLAARELAHAGLELRLLARSPERVRPLPGATVLPLTYGDTPEAVAALAGVEVLLMVSASEDVDRRAQHLGLVDAAAAAGVRHVVYTSFVGASPDATFTLVRDHWATEERIRAAGMGFTFLRDNLYADFFPDMAGPDGVIRGPADDGAVAAVARADVARSAVAVLRDPAAHRNQTYDLTGPEALTLNQVASVVSEVTGRPTRFVDETLDEAYASRASYGAPSWQVDAWVSTYTAIASGELAAVSDDVRALTGREPLTLRALLSGES